MSKKKKVLVIVGGLFALMVILAITTPSGREGLKEGSSVNMEDETVSSPTPKSENELEAEVKVNETQFVVENKNDFDWKECEFEANSGLVKGGYTYEPALDIKAGEIYSIDAREFVKSDGTRYDPASIKEQNFAVRCQGEDGEELYGYYEWN